MSVVMALASTLAVSWVISQQYLQQSNELLSNASQVINDHLIDSRKNQLNATRQLATQKNLGSTLWYLSKYAQMDTRGEMLFVTYQKLVKDTHKLAQIAKLSRVGIYDATGHLISFAILKGSSEMVGFVENYSDPFFQVARLNEGEELNRNNMKKMTSVANTNFWFDKELPQQESMHYTVIDGMLSIESYVPIMGEMFNPQTGKQEIRQLGFVVSVQPFDQDFVEHLSHLINIRINVFTPRGFSRGSLGTYQKPDWSGLPLPSPEHQNAAFNEISVKGEKFYQGLIPLFDGQQHVGTIATLHSGEIVRKNTYQMIRTLGVIAVASLLLILPFSWYLANSISRPLTVLSRIFRSVADGKQNDTLSDELLGLQKELQRDDELGDLTQSFMGMNEAIEQKIQEIKDINAGLEDTIEKRTVELNRAKQRAESINVELGEKNTKLEIAHARLRISETRLQTILDNSPIAIWMVDINGKYQFINKTFCNAMGRSESEILCANHLSEVMEPEAAAACIKSDRECLEQDYPHLSQETLTFVDGKPHLLEVTKVKFRDDQENITGIIGVGIDITERKAAEEEIRSLAFYDPLTCLPNRRLLMDRLKYALAASVRTGREGALLFIDLDNFKNLNDTHGHDMGDVLLQQVAKRLEACVRQGDTVSRLGGDEFVLMLEDLSNDAIEAAKQTEFIAEKVLAVLNHPYLLGSCEYHSTPSIGAALFCGHQQTTEELMKQADTAMYQAKKAGRNAFRFYDPVMQQRVMARISLENDLRTAILEQKQFQLFYQPQVDEYGYVTGAEALLRWFSTERGLVLPDNFISLTEESGQILPLGSWVLASACQQLASWAMKPETSHLTLAVNISARQVKAPNFVDEVASCLETTGADPAKLKLEITESMLLDNEDGIAAKMTALKSKGVRFSMDDFGTGYSSLRNLQRLPLDQLKIDRSFVQGIANNQDGEIIIQTIIAMANNLGVEVMAEGVETELQKDFLIKHDCRNFQGYLFGKPVSLAEFEQLVVQGGMA